MVQNGDPKHFVNCRVDTDTSETAHPLTDWSGTVRLSTSLCKVSQTLHGVSTWDLDNLWEISPASPLFSVSSKPLGFQHRCPWMLTSPSSLCVGAQLIFPATQTEPYALIPSPLHVRAALQERYVMNATCASITRAPHRARQVAFFCFGQCEDRMRFFHIL